jgi:hypothetical protein
MNQHSGVECGNDEHRLSAIEHRYVRVRPTDEEPVHSGEQEDLHDVPNHGTAARARNRDSRIDKDDRRSRLDVDTGEQLFTRHTVVQAPAI